MAKLALIGLALALAACGAGQQQPTEAAQQVVNVYSSRHYDADAVLFERFEKETGIDVRTIEAPGDQLIARLQAEGDQSPADVVLTVDAGNLWRLTEAGLLQPVQSATLEAAIPEALRDPQDRWFGFTKRARVIVYAKDRVDPASIASFDALAAPALRGKVCARTSTNVYNLSLLAARIEAVGVEAATEWARGVAANFARDPQGSDSDQIRAVAAGVCDVAIVNHYYLVRLAKSEDPADREVAAKVALVFPAQAGGGVHVNVSGGGVAAHAPNRDAAIQLLEYLASASSQAEVMRLNDEYPVRADVPPPPELTALGTFTEAATPLSALGARQAEAQAAFDQAGWR